MKKEGRKRGSEVKKCQSEKERRGRREKKREK